MDDTADDKFDYDEVDDDKVDDKVDDKFDDGEVDDEKVDDDEVHDVAR